MCTQVVRPIIPYRGVIPNGIHEGKVIEIKGSIPYGADVFTINLVTGLDVVSDKPLHLSVRFAGRVCVRNHFERGAWGSEERGGPFPFSQGAGFTVTVVVEATRYRVSVNHQQCWQFNHRIPFQRVSSILIDGCVQIERIEFVDRPSSYISTNTYVPPAQQFPARVGPNLVPVYNPNIPYAYPIYGGLKQGMAIHISAMPKMFANRFTINLQSGSSPHPPPDIALHFDARFGCRTLVRNSRIRDTWEREETDLATFPFESCSPFSLCIRVQRNRFAVELAGRHLLVFQHRLRPLQRFDTMVIEGDVQVTCIRFEMN